MANTFTITLAQLNPTVGDLNGNAEKAFQAWLRGKNNNSNLVALPEMFVTGYNPQDLISKPSFYSASIETVKRLITGKYLNETAKIQLPKVTSRNWYTSR